MTSLLPITLLLALLRVSGAITIPWWLVFFPLWGVVAAGGVVFLTCPWRLHVTAQHLEDA